MSRPGISIHPSVNANYTSVYSRHALLGYIEVVGIKGCRPAGCRFCFPVRISQLRVRASRVLNINVALCGRIEVSLSPSRSLSSYLAARGALCTQGGPYVFASLSRAVRESFFQPSDRRTVDFSLTEYEAYSTISENRGLSRGKRRNRLSLTGPRSPVNLVTILANRNSHARSNY